MNPTPTAPCFDLLLSKDKNGTLTANGPAQTFASTRVGQNARYTFGATAGQNLSLLVSGNTYLPSSAYVSIYKPDGTLLSPPGTYVASASAAGLSIVRTFTAPDAGTYTVFVSPWGASTGTMNIELQ